MSEQTLSAPIGVISVDGTVLVGHADLAWTATDPCTVRMTFRVAGEEPVEWIVARGLLLAGVGATETVGQLDVKVRGNGAGKTVVLLHAPEGVAEVLIPDALLVEFLDRCEDICPAGAAEVGEPTPEDERLGAQVEAMLLAWPRHPSGALAYVRRAK